MWKRRTIGCLMVFICFLVILLGRLMEIELFFTETFSKHHINLLAESVKQRTQELVINNGRGKFLDRHGKWLTQQKIAVLVLFPFLQKLDWDADRIAQITGIPGEKLRKDIDRATKPFVVGGEKHPFRMTSLQAEQINRLNMPGVYAIEKSLDRTKIPAEQLIGLVGENPGELKKRYPGKNIPEPMLIGISGLEQSFDEFLLPEGKTKLIYHVDGTGAPLFKASVRYVDPANPFYPVNVRTTIDRKIQQYAEKLVDHYHIKKGGLVLLDLTDNSVLAMVSRPNMNRENPYKGTGIKNMMVTEQIIGSIFKTVTAAAAIDYQLDSPDRRFDCNKKINGSPESTYQYGMLDFKDSFARSCNRTFGQLARELTKTDRDILQKYATKLSLLGPVGWQGDVYHTNHFKQLSGEEHGRVFFSEKDRQDPNYVAMTGIGQHEVRATPLAVANMMATIARGGRKEMVRAVSRIEYRNGTTMLRFNKQDLQGETVSPYTAMKLQKLLREVVVNAHGTGRGLQNLPYDVAGKSGTAETDKYRNGIQLHNKWFAGYFPYRHPQYALVTVNLDVPGDEGGVNSLFADLVKMLAEWD